MITNAFVQMGKLVAANFQDQNFEDKVELVMNDYELKQEGDKLYAVKKDLCPFCKRRLEGDFIYENDSFFAVYDQYPVSPGHALIISKRHVDRYFKGLYSDGLTAAEKYDLIDAIEMVQNYLSRSQITEDFNVGFNNGTYAGQTVNHFHCHVIPRYKGDVEDPKGGIRGCVPNKMKYEYLNPNK